MEARLISRILTVLSTGAVLLFQTAFAGTLLDIQNMNATLLNRALEARDAHASDIHNDRYMVVIDYRKPSSVPRFFLVDLQEETVENMLVAHGKGSDPDHDGMADKFSNTPDSKMTSLGSFVTGPTYYGRHGLSLRLIGLEKRNDKAEARAIVIHGAEYVDRGRKKLGRSWGCPALSNADAQRVIPLIKDGVFVYAVGRDKQG